MRLLIEGPDNAGKTTLARWIQANCAVPVDYHHAGGPPRDLQEEQLCMDTQAKLVAHNDFVMLDRITCVSQQVYNPDLELDRVRQVELMHLLRTPDLLLVYCRPSTDRLMRVEDLTWRTGETEGHKQKIIANQHEFIGRYDEIMVRVPHVIYDFDDGNHAAQLRGLLLSALEGDPAAKHFLKSAITSKGNT